MWWCIAFAIYATWELGELYIKRKYKDPDDE